MKNIRTYASDELAEFAGAKELSSRFSLFNSCLTDKIIGGFNKIKYSIKELHIPLTFTKKYVGIINGKETEYIVNPERGKLHKGKIQGQIGNNNVNLIVISDLFGRKTISGLYKNEQIELLVYKDFFSFHIDGKATNVIIKRNFLSLDKMLEGKFEYDDELMPLIIAYIKLSNNIINEEAA